MFSDTSNLKFLSWKDVGDKYFTIQHIYPQFEKVRISIKIGMTKEMCQEAWGTTFDIKKFTDKERQKELWRYEGKGKLIFENGKLINILE
jgi:hypothetical protein